MHYYRFVIPPFPYYVEANEDTYEPGRRHIDRRNFEFFDFIFVTRGCLFLNEEDAAYTLTANHGLILAPYLHHFAPKPVDVETHFYWVHFLCPTRFTIESSPSQSAFDQMTIPNTFTTESPDDVIEDFKSLCQAFQATDVVDVLNREQHLLSLFRTIAGDTDSAFAGAISTLARRSLAIISESFTDPEFNINRLKAQLNFDASYVSRCIKRVYGFTAKQYLVDLRLKRASSLLKSSNLSISTVAEQSGFNSLASFSKDFKQRFETTPSAFRNQYRS